MKTGKFIAISIYVWYLLLLYQWMTHSVIMIYVKFDNCNNHTTFMLISGSNYWTYMCKINLFDKEEIINW